MLRTALICTSAPVQEAVASGLTQVLGTAYSLARYAQYDAFASEGFGRYDVLFWHVEAFTPVFRQQAEALRARDCVVSLILVCGDVACALWGYQVRATAVLPTPLQPSALEVALQNAEQDLSSEQKKAFSFETREGLSRVYQSGVRRVFLSDGRARVETQTALYECTEELDALTRRLDARRFLRCGTSVYNLDCVWRIDRRSVTLSRSCEEDGAEEALRPTRFPIAQEERQAMITRLRARCIELGASAVLPSRHTQYETKRKEASLRHQ